MASAGNQAEAAAECAVAKPGFEASKAKAGNGRPISLASVATPSRGGRSREGGAGAHNGGADKGSRGPTSALEDLMRRKGVDEAWNALEEMQRQKTTTDKYTVSRMLMKTVGDGRGRLNPSRVYRGIALVEKFIDLQPKDVDEVLFNALLDTCCRLKDLSRLESIVNRMRELNVQPSPVTLGILVKTYGQAGDMQKVLQVWGDMEKQRGQANAVTYGCMIDACVKCGRQQKAIEIFQDMKRKKEHRNTILYTTLIKGYGMEKDLRRALALFREMKGERVPCNRITYNSIIDVCIRCGDVQAAENLFGEMTAPGSGVEPDLITFSTLLKGYCHAGELDKALQVAEGMKSIGLRTDELVYNTLMDGCVRANDLSAGIGLLAELVRSGLTPSPITYSILVRLYQRGGSYSASGAVEAVGQLYEHHGLPRPSAPPALERRGRGRRGRAQHVSVEKPRHAAGATSKVWTAPAAPAAPAAQAARLQLMQALASQAPAAQPAELQALQPLAQQGGVHQHFGVEQAQPGFDGAAFQLPISAGQPDVAADIGEAMRAAQAQAARAQAAQVQAQAAQAALAAYKSIGLMQSLELQPNSLHSKEGAGGPPAACSGQTFPNLLQHAARGTVPVAMQADPAAGQFYYGTGVYRGGPAPVSAVPPFAFGGQ
mmetsp:Transcript_103207/g.269441  ORF Transcript_103207/g.269441 Transcript_103207/m.269441 type:complete len:657 (+) Transcript_103207:57-2027(+)